jgi:aminoglycoside phosphotransferase (APT) family kinase protein
LYVDGKANAFIDWELASIGAQGLDVGWLMMLADGLVPLHRGFDRLNLHSQ